MILTFCRVGQHIALLRQQLVAAGRLKPISLKESLDFPGCIFVLMANFLKFHLAHLIVKEDWV